MLMGGPRQLRSSEFVAVVQRELQVTDAAPKTRLSWRLDVASGGWKCQSVNGGGQGIEEDRFPTQPWWMTNVLAMREMLDPGLVISSLRGVSATETPSGYRLTARPRRGGMSGSMSVLVVPEATEWSGLLEMGSGVLLEASSMINGQLVEVTRLNWQRRPELTALVRRDDDEVGSAVDTSEQALVKMAGFSDRLAGLQLHARSISTFYRAALRAVTDVDAGSAGPNGDREWRGFHVWGTTRWPKHYGNLEVLREVLVREREADEESDFTVAEELALGYDIGKSWEWDAQETLLGEWKGARREDGDVRDLYFPPALEEMIEPIRTFSAVEFDSVELSDSGYLLRGRPRVPSNQTYPVIVQPHGDLWQATVDRELGTIIDCSTSRKGVLLSAHSLGWIARPTPREPSPAA
jgi:hypothetical protein